MNKGAAISECGKYRYALWRIWDDRLLSVLFIGLNPSTADQTKDDPTLLKCMEFARRWDYGGIYLGNLFAYRATQPAAMKQAGDPVGPANDGWLKKLAGKCKLVVAAWGEEGDFLQRSASVRSMLNGLHYLKLNKSGEPSHPLYLPSTIRPAPLPPLHTDRLDDTLLAEYADKFYGFGNWSAKIWFVGIEEAGGWERKDVQARLVAWKDHRKPDLADAQSFYPASGQHNWHSEDAKPQATWTQLIRMLLVARGIPDTGEAILEYQRKRFGKADGRECLAELLPLPSPGSAVWRYPDWADLSWLRSRARYQNHVLLTRAALIQQRIETHQPKVVIFYSSTWHRIWAAIARGVWEQAIDGKLMVFERDGMSFYVTRHPRAESNDYFRQIGEFLKERHGNRH